MQQNDPEMIYTLSTYHVDHAAQIQISQWKGKADITIAPLDDKKFYLGIDFFNMVKAFLMPYTNTM